MHTCDRLENRIGIEAMVLRGALELERQHVQQHFAVRIRVDVPEIELEQLAFQRFAVSQVAVVAERDAERRVDVERLRLKVGERRPGCRIATMSDAGVSEQVAHVPSSEHVADVTGTLPHVENRALRRGDAGGRRPGR